MGKPGKKASNIFQNPGIKNNSDVKLPMLTALGSPAKMGHKESPAKKGCYKK
tara:strand:- start:37 stop:192 length:156 start_codon:yes stop_codon:yes gene_type:complete